jgi:hypothetical protein
MGDDPGVVPQRSRHHPDDVTSWQNPINGPCRASQGWCRRSADLGFERSESQEVDGAQAIIRPTHGMRPHDRPIPAASWIIDPTIPAAS